jgi:hypothetical protein
MSIEAVTSSVSVLERGESRDKDEIENVGPEQRLTPETKTKTQTKDRDVDVNAGVNELDLVRYRSIVL